MMAITTSSSISVKARRAAGVFWVEKDCFVTRQSYQRRAAPGGQPGDAGDAGLGGRLLRGSVGAAAATRAAAGRGRPRRAGAAAVAARLLRGAATRPDGCRTAGAAGQREADRGGQVGQQ